MSLKNIFLNDDIFPLGSFETLPVNVHKSGHPDDYPDVLLIKTDINANALLEEAYDHIERIGFTYVKGRMEYLNSNINEDTLRSMLEDVGFAKKTYQSFSLRKIGTNILEEWIKNHTRNFFKELPVNVFRQQYAVAYPKWNIKLHRDHKDFLTHGFRAMVPLDKNVYMAYEDSDKNPIIYKLVPGNMYFVNIGKMHRGFNESETESRLNLLMQMDSDIMLLNGKEVKPMLAEDIDKLPEYATKYDVWRFGYEL
jgi:hypothetical protein